MRKSENFHPGFCMIFDRMSSVSNKFLLDLILARFCCKVESLLIFLEIVCDRLTFIMVLEPGCAMPPSFLGCSSVFVCPYILALSASNYNRQNMKQRHSQQQNIRQSTAILNKASIEMKIIRVSANLHTVI